MFIVKADHPDVDFEVVLPELADSEGNKIPAADMVVELSTSDPDAIDFTFPKADQDNPLLGSAHFGKPLDDGTPRQGTLTANVTRTSTGQLVAAFSESFTIPPGDPTQVIGGAIKFPSLEAEQGGSGTPPVA